MTLVVGISEHEGGLKSAFCRDWTQCNDGACCGGDLLLQSHADAASFGDGLTRVNGIMGAAHGQSQKASDAWTTRHCQLGLVARAC